MIGSSTRSPPAPPPRALLRQEGRPFPACLKADEMLQHTTMQQPPWLFCHCSSSRASWFRSSMAAPDCSGLSLLPAGDPSLIIKWVNRGVRCGPGKLRGPEARAH